MATHDPTLLDALESLGSQAWSGRVWRHMFNDNPPERPNYGGARWNPPTVGAIYTALDRDTAIAEGQHAIDVQPRRIFRRRVLYELKIDLTDVVDLTAMGALDTVGLSMADISSDNMTTCQTVGGAAAWLGRSGLLVPSARSSGHNMVILIGPTGDAEMERAGVEVLFDDPPPSP